MAQSGFTPIQLYRSSTAAAAPTAGNLADGELAINTTDEKLYFKNAGGTVKLLASSASATGTVSSVDGSGGTTGLTLTGGPITTSGTLTLGGTLAVANGGTGGTTASAARTNLGATTIGANLFTLTNPSAVTFPRFNADNTVSALDAATFRTAIGAGTGGGSVTSVAFSGGTTGLTVTGSPITTSGTITLAGTLAVANGGTGTTTAFTAGSVVFAGASGVYTQDNANLFWDDTNNRLGIGTSSPSAKLSINDAAASKINFLISSTERGYIDYTESTSLMRLDSDGDISLAANNAEVLRVSAFGRIGIGTTAPSAKLTVAGGNIRLDNNQGLEWGGGNNYIFGNETTDIVGIATNGSERMRIDSSGNLGVGGTPSTKLDVAATGGMMRVGGASGNNLIQAYTGSVGLGLWAGGSSRIYSGGGITFSINGTLGTSAPTGYTDAAVLTGEGRFLIGTTTGVGNDFTSIRFNSSTTYSQGLNMVDSNASASGTIFQVFRKSDDTNLGLIRRSSTDNALFVGGNSYLALGSGDTERARITSAGYLEATYSDKVVALGNTGTAKTIDLTQGNVFTATLTGNCTFTLSNPNGNANTGSSFTLILTNDATAGRTVAWAGGNFRFPGGAASLSRTTTANAVDIWVFFTPDNGTTWYGNISMKNMTA